MSRRRCCFLLHMSAVTLLECGNGAARRPALQRWFGPMRTGSLRAATLVLTITAIGTGVLALPFAMSRLGWVAGACMIVLAGLLNIASIEILLEGALRHGSRSYAELLYAVQGPATARLLEVILVIDCWGAIVAYFVFLGENLPPLLSKLSFAAGIASQEVSKLTVLPAVAVLIFAACIPRGITAIGHCSLLGVLSILYLLVLLVCSAVSASLEYTLGHLLEVPALPNQHLSLRGIQLYTNCFAVIIFSFLCQSNVFLVYCDLARPTMKRLRKVVRVSAYFQILCYLSTALCGCIAFGNAISDDVYLSFPSQSRWVSFGRTILCCALCISIPLNVYPARATIIDLVSHWLPTSTVRGYDEVLFRTPPGLARLISVSGDVMCEGVAQVNAAYHFEHRHHEVEESCLGAGGLVRARSPCNKFHREGSPAFSSHQHPSRSLFDGPSIESLDAHEDADTALQEEDPVIGATGWMLHLLISGLVIIVSLILAFLLPSISMIMGAIGGICGVLLMYVLPGLVLMKMRDLWGPGKRCIVLTGFSLATFVGTSSVLLSAF